ncbi:MAG TPA: Mo-dependent nitrogenase C-terminal domain-containing protein [Candidatus Obscuribacterales bacterium]
MSDLVQSPPTSDQISAWLRGLLAIAWADGNFDQEEQDLITSLTQQELAPTTSLENIATITPSELAASLGQSDEIAQHFLRTAVMVAIADGTYSAQEDGLLEQFCQALGQSLSVLEALRHTLYNPQTVPPGNQALASAPPAALNLTEAEKHDLLHPVREWLDELDVQDPQVARFLCKLIPAQCPFERDIQLFGRKVVHIPPLCKLNPLYEQLVSLRFRALSYLADKCGEDVTPYC